MTAPATYWSTEDLPGQRWDPEPDDDTDGPWCRTPGLLPEQRDRIEAVDVVGELL